MEDWRKFLKEDVPSIESMNFEIEDYQRRGCTWDYASSKGMKVFFDITSYSHEHQNAFGKAIIIGNAIGRISVGQFKGAMSAANHVGFIFSDGSICHATNGGGIGVNFESSIKDMQKNPHQYVVLDLGGDENGLKQVCQDMIEELSKFYEPSQAYDWKGIARQTPLIGKLLAHLPFTREENEYSYYCSELVANALVRVGFMSAEELAARTLKESLGATDELSPTELYNLISKKATLLKASCEINKPKNATMQRSDDSQKSIERNSQMTYRG